MSDLTFYPCGGFGLNILAAFKEGGAKTDVAKNANVYGIDFSSNNLPKPGLFDVVCGEGGSGKYRATNADGHKEFVNSFMAKYKPSKYNVVAFGSSGGSGSLLGPEIVNWLLSRGYNVVCLILDDNTSNIEEENSMKTYMTLDNYRKRNDKPVVYHNILNAPDRTRREVNNDFINVMNLLSLMLDDTHGELDHEDISNFLNFSKAVKVPSVITRLNFMDQETMKLVGDEMPVASLSLFKDRDSIRNCWAGVQYRATGVFRENVILPQNMTEFHATLDYGPTVKELLRKIENYKDREATTIASLAKVSDIGNGEDGPIL